MAWSELHTDHCEEKWQTMYSWQHMKPKLEDLIPLPEVMDKILQLNMLLAVHNNNIFNSNEQKYYA